MAIIDPALCPHEARFSSAFPAESEIKLLGDIWWLLPCFCALLTVDVYPCHVLRTIVNGPTSSKLHFGTAGTLSSPNSYLPSLSKGSINTGNNIFLNGKQVRLNRRINIETTSCLPLKSIQSMFLGKSAKAKLENNMQHSSDPALLWSRCSINHLYVKIPGNYQYS